MAYFVTQVDVIAQAFLANNGQLAYKDIVPLYKAFNWSHNVGLINLRARDAVKSGRFKKFWPGVNKVVCYRDVRGEFHYKLSIDQRSNQV